MPEDPVTNVSEQSQPEIGGSAAKEELRYEIKDLAEAKKLFAEFDDFQRFKLQTTLDFMDKLSNQVERGTTLYEKLILLDGATIALSITLLASLSNRLITVHGADRPHLWMIDVSWCLLILSIFFSYRVIVRRHGASLSIFVKFSSEFTTYIYQRIGVVVSHFRTSLKGNVKFNDELVDVSKVLEIVPSLLEREKDETLKKHSDLLKQWGEGVKETVYARLAVYSTIAAVVLLCVFTVLSLRLLF